MVVVENFGLLACHLTLDGMSLNRQQMVVNTIINARETRLYAQRDWQLAKKGEFLHQSRQPESKILCMVDSAAIPWNLLAIVLVC